MLHRFLCMAVRREGRLLLGSCLIIVNLFVNRERWSAMNAASQTQSVTTEQIQEVQEAYDKANAHLNELGKQLNHLLVATGEKRGPGRPRIHPFTPQQPNRRQKYGNLPSVILRGMHHDRPTNRTEMTQAMEDSDFESKSNSPAIVLGQALSRLKTLGMIKNVSRGEWQITARGIKALEKAQANGTMVVVSSVESVKQVKETAPKRRTKKRTKRRSRAQK